ncbi:MAG: c-type cytochrome [Verrucomicrobiota bacterium]
MNLVVSPRAVAWTALVALAALIPVSDACAQTKPVPGLMVTYKAGGATDTAVAGSVSLYVPAGQAVSPFVGPGKFTAEWSGYASADLRDSFTFQAELSGAVKVEVNGAIALDVSGTGNATEPGKPVRLNKGTNAFKVTFTSPDQGDAFLRLFWSSPDVPWEPVPATSVSRDAEQPEAAKGQALRLGRELIVEHRCAKCHVTAGNAIPELAMDAPAFDGIGSRRGLDWMADWIADPRGQRPTAHMPKMFHGAQAKDDARAAAAYLASLKDTSAGAGADPAPNLAAAGKELFATLHCVACHNAPDDAKQEPARVSLKHVRRKFPAGQLVAFLQKPDAHYAWIRMPDFKLAKDEADKLGAYLISAAEAPKPGAAPDAALVARGKQLVQSSGCLNCHGHKLENSFKAKSLAELAAANWKSGCLAEAEGAKAPFYAFKAEERAALQAFAATDRTSLTRHVGREAAERLTRNLNCAECHGKFDGFPALHILGGKFKPEWSEAFIAGKVGYKPRPWIEARMPAFAQYAAILAPGMAMQHGYAPKAPAEPPVNPEAAQLGLKLIGVDGGFSCIACHAVKDLGATQVFESAGVNLAYSGERLLPQYFQRWLTNPLRIDPQTKMPVYFDQGRSPLTDYFEGDANKQIDALWQYFRLGDKMPLPKEATQ